MPGSASTDVLGLSDYAWERLRDRIVGLTDEEYRWEPVAGSDAVTTIAWRMAHLAEGLAAERIPVWLGLASPPLARPSAEPSPASAEAAVTQLSDAYAFFRACLDALDEDDWPAPIGEVGGPYASASHASFALHMIDELIHHGAEVALVRDLYGAQRSS